MIRYFRKCTGRVEGWPAGQTPEVDSLTYLTGRRFEPGEFVEVRCQSARGYDLIAQPTPVILPLLS